MKSIQFTIKSEQEESKEVILTIDAKGITSSHIDSINEIFSQNDKVTLCVEKAQCSCVVKEVTQKIKEYLDWKKETKDAFIDEYQRTIFPEDAFENPPMGRPKLEDQITFCPLY